MPGHGTLISSTAGQDDGLVAVDNNGGSSDYNVGDHESLNHAGQSLSPGDVVEVDWDSTERKVEITKVGNRAQGNVNEEGTQITITSSGDTELSGTVNISSTHGENEGWGGTTGVYCGNVNGEAAYLSE